MKPLHRFAVALLGAPVACTPAATGHKVSAPPIPPGAEQDRAGGESTPPPSPVPTTTTTEAPEPTTTVTVTMPTVPPTTTTWTTTRTALVEYADEALTDAEWWEAQEGYSAESDAFWYRLATCESGNGRLSANQFQFMGGTAEKVGYYAGASYEEQRAMARAWAARLRAEGTHPGSRAGWPVCWWKAGGS